MLFLYDTIFLILFGRIQSIRITRAEFPHKEFLDSHSSLQRCLHSQVRYVEAALPQHSLNSEFSTLQGGMRSYLFHLLKVLSVSQY